MDQPSKYIRSEDSGIAGIIVDMETGEILNANPQAVHLLNMPKQKIIGRNVCQFLDRQVEKLKPGLITINQVLCTLSIEEIEWKDKKGLKLILKPASGGQEEKTLDHYSQIAEQIVHQFRSPLTGVSGFVEILEESETSASKLKILEKIRSGLQASFTLLNRIEIFAQPVSANISTFDISILVQQLLQSFPEEKREWLLIENSETNKITSDFYLLKTILAELVDNALYEIRNIENQKVIISFSRKGIIEIENRLSSGQINDIEKLFIPFYTTSAGKTGLGLSICKKYSKQMNLLIGATLSENRDSIKFQIRNILIS